MKTKIEPKYFILLNILFILQSFGGVFSKLAGRAEFLSLSFIVYYGLVLLILLIYAFFWQILLKRISLTTAYANRAIAMVWLMIWGVAFFGETISFNMIIGALIVLAGIGLVVTAPDE